MLKILLVEDNPVFRESFKQSLFHRFRSLVFKEAEAVKRLWRKSASTPPHLVFMDLRLLGISGL